MSTKDQVLAMLARAPGQYFSGQEIADRLGLTRASVWKSIQTLKNSGYNINAVTNRGYALSGSADIFNESAVASLIGDLPLKIEVCDILGSTNSAVRERAVAGEPEGLVIIAQEQTEGRGRSGREFHSPAGGLYMSMLLRPKFAAPKAQLLTSLAAVAAARAAEKVCGRDIKIKWVNDLFCDGRKVCGILTEAALSLESDGLDYAVLGLGFNVEKPADGWPESIKDIAGSLFEEAAPPGTRAKLAAEFLKEFFELYADFDLNKFLPEYRSRQVVIGREIEVISSNSKPKLAMALGIDDDCRLIVRYSDGQEASLFGGEVRIIL